MATRRVDWGTVSRAPLRKNADPIYRKRNLIFDVDGTLLDSKRDIAAAQQYALNHLGVHSYRCEDLYPHIGKPLQDTFSTLLPLHLHHRIPEAAVVYREYYRARALETTSLFPGVQDALEQLFRKGFRLAVATTKSTETTELVLHHFGIGRLFIHIQGGTPDIPFKPDPFIIEKILRDQEWSRDETVMVGDSAADVGAGKAAGVSTCGVTYGSSTREQMEALKPDWIIDRLPQIMEILDKEQESAA